ncbi:hypothetical protein E3N88_33543 [Mikania micrantha]|uniref:Uncharacterized protein n=1 Tax=Mikania micrantha TaxID=192012 RepID=A0A5N6MC43_9ASTR|nr:hypothetical protein E3N88_33543 [Mikania micrantha]
MLAPQEGTGFLGYLRCNSSSTIKEENHVTIGEHEVPKTTKFKYLGLFVQSNGDIDCDVAHRVQAGWNRWRAATSILCDKRDENVKMNMWSHKGRLNEERGHPGEVGGNTYLKQSKERKVEMVWTCEEKKLVGAGTKSREPHCGGEEV